MTFGAATMWFLWVLYNCFSSTMAIDNLVSVSEQQLVDCDKIDPDCIDGLMDNANRLLLMSNACASEV